MKLAFNRSLKGGNADPIQSLIDGMEIYYNYTGEAGSCFNVSVASTSAIGNNAWDYQVASNLKSLSFNF